MKEELLKEQVREIAHTLLQLCGEENKPEDPSTSQSIPQVCGLYEAYKKEEPVLCFVHGDWAYFTTQPLADQWGDDWNDIPYEHNAGYPYYWREDSGDPPWRITKVAWKANMKDPAAEHCNSPYSVKQINAGKIHWLRPESWAETDKCIPAGATLQEFCEIIQEAGGSVYVEVPRL